MSELPNRERLQEVVDGDIFFTDEQRAVARALLAAHEQEPVVNSEATETLQKICNIFRIGIQAQTQSTILANVENVVRFADQLHAIEREFFMVPGEPDEDYPDDEPADVCLVNCWGSTTERYVEQFRAALMRVALAAPSIPADDVRIVSLDALGAACGALQRYAPESNTLALLRRYTFGDLSNVRPAPSIPAVVPEEVVKAILEIVRVRNDLHSFDGDKRGIAQCLCEKEEALICLINEHHDDFRGVDGGRG